VGAGAVEVEELLCRPALVAAREQVPEAPSARDLARRSNPASTVASPPAKKKGSSKSRLRASSASRVERPVLRATSRTDISWKPTTWAPAAAASSCSASTISE
jgi:hypothetical protein